ncbi:MAG: hypothetical protein WCR30_00070 [Clostridia bacterium]
MEINNRLSGLLSIARKGKFAVIGLDNIKKHVGKCNLILICSSASDNLKKESKYYSEKFGAELLETESLEKLIKIDNCKIVGINNLGIASSIGKILRGEN